MTTTERTEQYLSWAICLIAAWHVAWTGYAAWKRAALVSELIHKVGPDAVVPTSTQVGLWLCRPPVLWIACGAAILFLFAKEIGLASSRTKVILSIALFMFAVSFSAVVTDLLFRHWFSIYGYL